jgi:lipoyl(octanoyl) transferase
VIQVERGGEVTYHGPGQLVAYPILALSPRGLMIRPLVRALEAALVATCAAHGVAAARRDGHPGCWCDPDGDAPRKIGALGLRVERGVTYHGIALNVTVGLADFDLIDPCGMPGVASTSIAAELGDVTARPSTESVERAAGIFAHALGSALDAPIEGI